MSRAFDVLVIGSEPDGLVAAITLAKSGSKVLLVEEAPELGGVLREIAFAPGFRAAPLAADLGYLDAEAFRAIGVTPSAEPASDPTVVALGENGPLQLRPSVSDTAAELKRVSDRDAARWPAFTQRVSALAGFLADLYRVPPPRIEAEGAGELLTLAGLGRKYRRLGQEGMVELLRALPVSAADWLDDEFESEQLKGALAALAVEDICLGAMSGGTALTFLHRHVGAAPGVIGERVRVKGGPGGFVKELVTRARAAGVSIETGAAVRQLVVRDDRIAGAVLASGEDITCRAAVSSLDPYRSLLGLVDPGYLDPEFVRAVRNIRFRGVATKVLLGIDSLPPIPGVATPPAGALVIAPSIRHVERAYDATKYGRTSEEPIIELRFPSVAQPDLAPAGRHVAVLHVQFTPYALREVEWSRARDAVAERAIATVERYLPGFSARIRERAVLTPPDLESRFGLHGGAQSQGELMLDQILFMRPVPAASRYATPIAGLYLCGAGTHPGPGIVGASARMAAKAVLAG
ncbi:MAG TPA: NAD(P)/FAD-dependent oxidoreductase [Steroidobacteraceae bacterium]|nr:NAD(P)/FAD-dependent oxidoreductase [Steroidobacteraceae bacterium]